MKTSYLLTAILTISTAFSAYAGTDMKEVVATDKVCSSDAGFYVGVYGGAQFDTAYGDKKQTISTPGGSTLSSHNSINSSWGGVGGIKAGYNFDSFAACDSLKLRLQPAVEVEALYIGGTSTSGFSGPDGYSAASSASYNSAAGFVNGILRFKTPSIVTPYIGVGAGVEYLTIHGSATTNIPGYTNVTGLNGNDVDFAAQALVGFDVAIAKNYSLFTEYKFIDALGTDAKTSDVAGSGLDYRFKPDQIEQNLIVAGLKYSF